MATFRENELIDAVIARFGELTGLQTTRQVSEAELGPWADRGVKIVEGNRQWVFPIACKTNVDRVTMLYQGTSTDNWIPCGRAALRSIPRPGTQEEMP